MEHDLSRGGDTFGPVLSVLFDLAVKQQLFHGRGNLFLFLDEPFLLRQNTFLRTVEALSGVVLTTVSIENASAIGSEDFLSRFNHDIILLDGETARLQKALTSLGGVHPL